MEKLIFVFTCLFIAIPCQAKTITVDNNETADFNNIQAAINDSNDGDIIIVQTGQYIENINFIGKNITLRSTEPMNPSVISSTIIDGDFVGSVVRFSEGETESCVLSGFTITNGMASGGVGGGIYCPAGSSPTVTNCTITGSWATGSGGGIGGAGSPTITNCIITGNEAVWDTGGGISLWGGSAMIVNCTISGNLAYRGGGGIHSCNSSPTITNCTINANTAYKGAGIFCEGGGSPTITNCIISGNSAERYGGGIDWAYSNPKITNCTFAANSAQNGNAIVCGPCGSYPCKLQLTNCILWDAETEIWNNYGSTFTINYSNVQGSQMSVYDPCEGLIWGEGNIDKDPCFVDANNGDYHLQSQAGRWDANSESWVLDDDTSPCIDAGNPGCPFGDEPSPNGNRINMGAYGGTAEASKSPANWRSIADLTNNWAVDSNDLKVFTDYWLQTGECIPSDFDRSQFVDFNDFAIFGQHWSYPSALEPGIVYQVQDCNMEGSVNQPSVADSNDTRFSVRVEGSYIHFEDLITANCCLDEIELQMTVEDGLITIFEIEHLTTPCFCLCDYPTTATLGPFEPGIYLLEVIDIDGKSLGIVEVTIGGSPEPGITYQIEECNRDASDVFAAEPPDPTRFKVTVEGLFIHFEDMMTANCCPDKLELEMAVEDNLITIYETEYTSEGCRCICSFPITATLGPFEPGSYTLEVYETMGGFIGSTTITIGPGE